MLAARFRGRKCGSKRLSSPVLEALFFYIKVVPRSDPVPPRFPASKWSKWQKFLERYGHFELPKDLLSDLQVLIADRVAGVGPAQDVDAEN